MMRGLKVDNVKRFKYYIRICKTCDGFFQAQTKLTRLCPSCKKESNKNKAQISLNSRLKVFAQRKLEKEIKI